MSSNCFRTAKWLTCSTVYTFPCAFSAFSLLPSVCLLQAGEGMEKVDLEDGKAKQKRGVPVYHTCARVDARMCCVGLLLVLYMTSLRSSIDHICKDIVKDRCYIVDS